MAEATSAGQGPEPWFAQARAAGFDLAADPAFVADAGKVWPASEFLVRACERDPALLGALWQAGELARPYTPGELDEHLAAALAGVADETALRRALRRFRQQQMVRIIWRDLAGHAPLDEVMRDLSDLADGCVEAALDHLYRWACAELGTPCNAGGEAQRLVVLGMGKLGAHELNLSSDIDLIFAFPENGATDGRRDLSNEQFFIQLGQRLVQVLSDPDHDGFVFRVDMRLRPFGDSGPLAASFAFMEDYYQSQAREWERYAMVKARVIAGDRSAGERLIAMLRPFVYRRYLDFGAIESLREMKAMISRELHRKGMADNIKLGPGGIREIEFIGQAFQLVRGGREPELQVRPILAVLERLGAKNYLPEFAVRDLRDAYLFLRRIENRIQAWADQQSHSLPRGPQARARLARTMGFADWEGFAAVLARHRERVQQQFDQIFAAPQHGAEQKEPALARVWNHDVPPAQAAELLAGAGFGDPEAALARIEALRESRGFRKLSEKGRSRLDRLMPVLLEAIAGSEGPDAALERVLRLIEAILRRSTYIALLVERPIVLSQLVRLSAVSPWIARLLTQHPLLLDELLDPRRLYAPLHRVELEAELTLALQSVAGDDLEQQMERLRQFAQSNILRVASADITGHIPLMVVSDFLTEIAEVVIGRVLEQAWHDLVARHGHPSGTGEGHGFGVIGYGKLGGIELGYGSDLDLVFLHGTEPGGTTDGPQPVANEVFVTRLGQRMVHIFSTQTASGILYEVDMRLRPNGKSGLLVASLDAFDRYQREDAWTWEHQALIRARFIAGDPGVGERFRAVRRATLARERDPDALRREVCDMRERMRSELERRRPGMFDLKHGLGGIADIEFMVQFAVLRWAHDHPELLHWTDNIRLLETLSRIGLLEGQEAELLAGAYRVFRAAYHRNALQDLPGLAPEEKLAEERAIVRAVWRRLMEA